MSLLRSFSLWIPALRGLVESRDRLLVELHLAQVHLAEMEQSFQIDSANQTALSSELGQQLQAKEEAYAGLLTDLEGLRRVHRQLEEDTATTRLAQSQSRLFITDYAYFPSPRSIENAAGGRQIEAMFKRQEDRISGTLRAIAQHVQTLALIPRSTSDALIPYWDNPWFPPFDGAALYGLIAVNKPRRYVEVGSGISTRFARQAIIDLGLSTKIISIDPHPHNSVEGLCDEVLVQRAENMPSEFWTSLDERDILFIDNSHRSFPGSDVTVFFAEVMPALPPGVIYGIHDIFLPRDYPADWNERFYSEQYLLMTYLLGGCGQDEILLPVNWLTSQPQLHGLLSSLWDRADLFGGLMTHGGAFWARRGAVPLY